jgi:hypothetical protein
MLSDNGEKKQAAAMRHASQRLVSSAAQAGPVENDTQNSLQGCPGGAMKLRQAKPGRGGRMLLLAFDPCL